LYGMPVGNYLLRIRHAGEVMTQKLAIK
jgi:hypothetical protein